MIKIYFGDAAPEAKLAWEIYKGASWVHEDFCRARVFLWVIGAGNKFLVECTTNHNVIEATIPRTLPVGVYSVRAMWVKDWCGKRAMSEVEKVFAITDIADHASPVVGDSFVIRVKSSAATYGYDGLSAYEMAVLLGKTVLSEQEWLDQCNGEHGDFFDNAEYDSQTKRINFFHKGTLVDYIDATAFIKDGMVDSVVINNGYLVITFNTDAGKEDISIPLTSIFDPNAYYTKEEVDEKFDEYTLGDKTYDPENFSGLGRVYLKKNLQEIGGVEKNVLVQDAFYKDDGEGNRVPNTNTVFVVGYAFDLNGQSINMPAGCVLEFNGGSVSNGLIESNDTILTGVFNSSVDSLFGVFYDTNKNAFGWGKNKIGNFKVETEYGNYITCIEPGIDFGSNQSIAIDENYVYLLFSKNYTSEGRELGYASIVVYDRNYNYKGYSVLSRPSHANGATICDGKIYIACSSRMLDNDSVHVVDIETLLSNCFYNKGRAWAEARNTEVTVINLGHVVLSIDYDTVTETFCLGKGAPAYYIYDKTLSTILKTSSINDYRIYGENLYGYKTTIQDFVYQNGVIHIFDWDYDIEGTGVSGTATSDQPSNSGVCYTIDVSTDKIIGVQPINYDLIYTEPEGVCKDAVTGMIYASGNNHPWYRTGLIFSVCAISYDNEIVGAGNRQSIVDPHWIDDGTSIPVFINNNPENTGRSCGSQKHPYKTFGEALVMAGGSSKRVEFVFIYSGIPYYIDILKLSDTSLRLYGGNNGPNGEYIEIDGTFFFRGSKVNVENLHFKPSNKRGNKDAIINCTQDCFVLIMNCKFTRIVGSVVRRALYMNLHNYLRVNNAVFSNSQGDNASHILTALSGNKVDVISATAEDGNLVTLGNFDQDFSCDNKVVFFDPNDIVLGENALLIVNNLRRPDLCAINKPVNSIAYLNKIKAFFSSQNGSRNIPSFSISFFISVSLTEEDGRIIRPGWYTNDFKMSGDVIDYTYIRSITDSNKTNGYSVYPQAYLPTSDNLGSMVYNNTSKIPVWWDGTQWSDAIKMKTTAESSAEDETLEDYYLALFNSQSVVVDKQPLSRIETLIKNYLNTPAVADEIHWGYAPIGNHELMQNTDLFTLQDGLYYCTSGSTLQSCTNIPIAETYTNARIEVYRNSGVSGSSYWFGGILIYMNNELYSCARAGSNWGEWKKCW